MLSLNSIYAFMLFARCKIKLKGEKRKMHHNNAFMKKKTSLTMTILLLLITSMMLAVIPAKTEAQVTQTGAPKLTPWQNTVPPGVTVNTTVTPLAFMSVTPTPVGIGQTLLVNLWLDPPINTNRFYSGYTVTITKPNGNNETIGPLNSFQGDSTTWFTYTPDQVGTWKFQFSFLGDYFPAGWYFNGAVYASQSQIPPYTPSMFVYPTYIESSYYQPAQSPVTTITVQQEPVAGWPAASLPTDYWTRPIPINDREWWLIGGQYPFDGQGGGQGWPANTNTYASNYKFTPYVQGPTTAHIAWLREGALGGVVGGQYGDRSVGPGESAYSGTPSIIFQGRGYQTISKPEPTTVNGTTVLETTNVWQCYDIRTGQVYWEQTGITQPPTLVTYNTAAPSEPGAGQTGMGTGTFSLLYVSGSRLLKYDPFSGAVQMNISLPFASSTVYADPNVLSIQNLPGGKYQLVNWTMPLSAAMGGSASAITINSNVSYPFSSLGTCDFESMVAVQTAAINQPGMAQIFGEIVMGTSLTTGQLLWNVTTDGIFFPSTNVADHGKFAVRLIGGSWDCFDLQTGKLLWKSPMAGAAGGETYPFGDFGAYTIASYGGLFYDFSYAGFYAYDWNTGKIVWHYVTPAMPFEVGWYPSMSLFSNAPTIADGILYYGNGEHSPTEPLARGWRLWALNATSGEEIWNIEGGGSAGAIADGYLTYENKYDGYMYVFGKGPSATTVSAPQTQISTGQNVVISGTVLDQSPGIVPSATSQSGSTIPFKNNRGITNVACVSANSMSTYMEYLYDQLPIDGTYHNVTVTGVPVSIDAVDPNNNYVHIGTVTSDSTGAFAFTWAPTIPGQYRIIATFAGDDSYGSSSGNTYATVTQATATPIPATPLPQSVADMYFVPSVIAIIVVIIIGFAVLAILTLRKRP
jgi:hypothetical protein